MEKVRPSCFSRKAAQRKITRPCGTEYGLLRAGASKAVPQHSACTLASCLAMSACLSACSCSCSQRSSMADAGCSSEMRAIVDGRQSQGWLSICFTSLELEVSCVPKCEPQCRVDRTVSRHHSRSCNPCHSTFDLCAKVFHCWNPMVFAPVSSIPSSHWRKLLQRTHSRRQSRQPIAVDIRAYTAMLESLVASRERRVFAARLCYLTGSASHEEEVRSEQVLNVSVSMLGPQLQLSRWQPR